MRIISIMLLLAFNISYAEDFDPEKFIAEGSVVLFGNGCLKFYPNPEAFDKWVQKNKFEEIPKEYSKGLIREKGGKAFSINNNGVRYALVAEKNNLCTVFVKEVNLEKAKNAFDRLRIGIKSGPVTESITSSEKKLSNGKVTTTNYVYKSKEGMPLISIVVSESDSSNGFFQLAMSASSQMRANNLLKK